MKIILSADQLLKIKAVLNMFKRHWKTVGDSGDVFLKMSKNDLQ